MDFLSSIQMQENSMAGMQQTIPMQDSLTMGMRSLENARGAVPEPLPELAVVADPIREVNYQIARKQLKNLRNGMGNNPDSNELFDWIYNVYGGSTQSFSTKRNLDGSLRTDMMLKEYEHLLGIINKFYLTVKELADFAQRDQEVIVYRGVRISKIAQDATNADIAATMSRLGDVIPSSASWNMGKVRRLITADEGQDTVIFHMTVPPDFPLVILSYPEEVREGDPIPINQSQQEVLVGASTFSDVNLLYTEKRTDKTIDYHCYHVGVRLNEVRQEDVIEGIRTVRNRSCGIVLNGTLNSDCLRITSSTAAGIFAKNQEELQVDRVYMRKDKEGEKYKLTKIDGLWYVFQKVNDKQLTEKQAEE